MAVTVEPEISAAVAVEAVAPLPPRARRRRRGRWFKTRIAVAVLATLVFLFPLYWMLVTAFSERQDLYAPGLHLWPQHFTVSNFTIPFQRFPVAAWFRNSAVITVLVTAITVVVNLLAGYGFAKLRFRGKTVLFLVLLATMMVPIQSLIVGQFKVAIHLHLYGNLWSVVLPESATAFGVFLARQFFVAIPDELLEAARVDGAGPLRTFWSVVLPLCKPLVAVLTLLTALYEWNSFSWPIVALFGNERLFTLPIGIVTDLQSEYASNYGAIMAITLLMIAPMVLLFLVFQRTFVQGLARTGIK